MKNEFVREYENLKEIKAAFEDEATKEKAVQAMRDFREALDQKGRAYARVFTLYEEAREAGNEHLDLADENLNPGELVENLKDCGIEAFTFSSTWSSAVETAWEFQQHGFRVDGMVEVSGRHKDWKTGEREKRPAYLFRLD